MLGYIVVNNEINSKDYGVLLTDADIYGKPERDIQSVSVAGRNGDLLLDNNRYKNVKVSYPCIILDNFDRNYSEIIDRLSQLSDKYVRIEDSFNPDIFIMARYTGATSPKKVERYGKDGIFNLTFDRKPQKYLKSGEYYDIINSGTTLYNQYFTEAKPLIRAYGTGTFTIGGVSIQITTANEYTDIDCEIMEAYKGSTNCNGNIVLTNGVFPSLKTGANVITYTGITRLDIKPRWWIL